MKRIILSIVLLMAAATLGAQDLQMSRFPGRSPYAAPYGECTPSTSVDPIPEIDVGPPVPGKLIFLNVCGSAILQSPTAPCPFMYGRESDGYPLDFGDIRQTVSVTGKVYLLGISFPFGNFWLAWGEAIHEDFSHPVPGCSGPSAGDGGG